MGYFSSVTELIGKTPLLKLNNLEKQNALKASVFAKLECFNPGSSAKDRIALQMLLDAYEVFWQYSLNNGYSFGRCEP